MYVRATDGALLGRTVGGVLGTVLEMEEGATVGALLGRTVGGGLGTVLGIEE